VWGGCEYGPEENVHNEYWDPADVTLHFEGKWLRKTTTGDIPRCSSGATAQVLNNTMFVLCGFHSREPEYNTNSIFALDLLSWTWSKLSPKGVPPLKCDKLSSWVHGGKVYGFGGFGHPPAEAEDDEEDNKVSSRLESDRHINQFEDYPSYMRVVLEYYGYTSRCWNNQLFCYDPSSNRWEWPRVGGSVPPPRAAHTTLCCGDAVLLFGGRLAGKRLNDLHVLDMLSLQWTKVHDSVSGEAAEGLPCGRSWHSLTRISPTAAVLFGGYNSEWKPLGDCWLLDTAACKTAIREPNSDPSTLWTSCRHHEQNESSRGYARLWHSAVLEPVSLRVWVIGGIINDLMEQHDHEVEHPWQILSMSFTSATPLRLLAMEAAIASVRPDDPDLLGLPRNLRNELEARRSNISEERRSGMVGEKSEKGG